MPPDVALKWTAEPLKTGSGAHPANQLRNASPTGGIEPAEFEFESMCGTDPFIKKGLAQLNPRA